MLNRLKGYFNGLLHVMNFINSIIHLDFFLILSYSFFSSIPSEVLLLSVIHIESRVNTDMNLMCKSVRKQDFNCWSTRGDFGLFISILNFPELKNIKINIRIANRYKSAHLV